jgi:hypothetical protein
MAATRWTAKLFVNSDVGEIDAEVYASTLPGARQQIQAKYGDVQQIYNLRQASGSAVSVSSGGGCAPAVGVLFLIICGMVVGGNGGGSDDYTPSESTQNAPMERVQSAPAPTTPSYANPPGPCVTADFTPC